MSVSGWIEILVFLAALTALTPVLGGYIARVFAGERVALTRVMGPVERPLYRLLGVDPARGQDWKAYARSVLVLSAVFGLVLYAILTAIPVLDFIVGLAVVLLGLGVISNWIWTTLFRNRSTQEPPPPG